MKTKATKLSKANKAMRQEILNGMVASFKIEGISISPKTASATLKKIEATLEI